ncbi:hypothetical protein KPH14_003994 [Odynerus spinipes]|uniref:Cytochrome b-c1 complex subunit 7 n=1 Tax=Odynerus spinipes TaxID=1348599 RepID=A0AAD9VUX9_9HYME|nr:hypothetical protein KPH14_003994 [Odynerus spinipes]
MLANIMKRIATPELRRWTYNISGFNQYGLMRDDLLTETNPDVVEALRRIPDNVRDERNFRLIRAMQLDAAKKVLPKEQWTKYEEDVLYLSPVVAEVVKEREEKELWNLE